MKRHKSNRVGMSALLLFVSGAVFGGFATAAGGRVVSRLIPTPMQPIVAEATGRPTGIPVRSGPYSLKDAEATTEPITFSQNPGKYAGQVVCLDWCHVTKVSEDGGDVTLNPGVKCRMSSPLIAQPTHYVKVVGRVEGAGLMDCQIVK